MVARIRCCKAADEFRIALAFTALPETPRKARA
jgi:hypothetical protein